MSNPSTLPSASSHGVFAAGGRRVALAVTFLTRLPLPMRGEVTPSDLRASMGWYPLVGLGLGALGWGVFTLSSLLFPPTLAAALTIILLEACTGALHLDGVMDTCDGLGSGAPRERALEIMKDSRVGAMGVFGAIAVILLKTTALAAYKPDVAVVPLLVGWAAARAVPGWATLLFPYARANGTGKVFAAKGSPAPLLFATVCALAAGALVAGLHPPAVAIDLLLRWLGCLLLPVLAVALTLLAQFGISRKLGGLTGDVYGLGIELAEVLSLLLYLAYTAATPALTSWLLEHGMLM